MAYKLTPHAIAVVRIPAILAIVLGEAAGAVFFVGTRSFLLVLAFAAVCAAINAAPLWFDRVQETGIEPVWVALGSYALVPGAYEWTALRTIDNIFYAVFVSVILVAAFLFFIGHPRRKELAAEQPEAQSAGLRYRSSLICALIAVTVFDRAIEFLRHHSLPLAWCVPAGLPVIWYAWMYALYRVELRKLNPTGNLSIIRRND
jgi:hypothetical protein